jgi:hypothetical protein
MNLFKEWIIRRLQRHFEDVPFNVVEPTVIAASEPPLLESAIFQGGTAMAATKKQHTRPTLSIAEGNQIFTKNSHPLGYICEISGQTDRLPIAAHQLAARRPRRNASQLGVGFGNSKSISALHGFALYAKLNLTNISFPGDRFSLPWRERVRVRGKIEAPSPLSSPFKGEDASSITFGDDCTNVTLLAGFKST